MSSQLERTHCIMDPDPLAGKTVKRCEFSEYEYNALKRIIFTDGSYIELQVSMDYVEALLHEDGKSDE